MKKHVEIVLDEEFPKVLIIGGGIIADRLKKYHEDNGCAVTTSESYNNALSKFNYIYQFGNSIEVQTGLDKHLKSNGKFLYIDIDGEENILTENIKIVRVGDLSKWDVDELVTVIIRSMFTGGKKILDVRIKPSVQTDLIRKLDKQTISFSGNQSVKAHELNNKIYSSRVSEKFSLRDVPSGTSLRSNNNNFRDCKTGTKSPVILEEKNIISTHKLFIFLSILLFVLFISITSFFIYIRSIKSTLSKLSTDYNSSNWTSLKNDIYDLKNKIVFLNKFYDLFDRIIFPLRWLQSWKDSGTVLSVSGALLENGSDMLTYAQMLQNRKPDINSTGNNISGNDLAALQTKMNNMQLILEYSNEKLKEINLPFLDKDNLFNVMQSVSVRLATIDELIPILEQIILTSSPKVYLVLFQNNMELRPTGGFIGSFALVTVDNGKMTNMKVYDVYTADGQLKGHVDPPLPIRKYLNQPHFFLRDSNFDPDFTVSAVQSAWFLQKEMGIAVDGVIGINLNVIQKILEVTGPVKLADFAGEEINSENFFFKAHYYSQEKFFPGSTQKKDFLTSASNTLLGKLNDGSKPVLYELIPSVKKLLDERNIMIYANDEVVQLMLEKKGWAGRMMDVKCMYSKNGPGQLNYADVSGSCLPDYLSINEANLGVNKANYFVNKSVVVEKNISKSGIITTNVTLSYQNSGTPEVFSGSIYSNYIRIFTPLGSRLVEATLNGVAYSLQDVTVENYQTDKTVFGLMVKIAPENKGIVKLVYEIPGRINPDLTSYQFLFQKQGGDKKAPFVLSVRYPSGGNFKPLNFTPNIEKNKDIYYSTDTSYDRIFAFSRF